MPIKKFVLLIIFCLIATTVNGEKNGIVYLLELKGAIGPASSDYIHRSLIKAKEEKVTVVILRIDTPGGLDSSMREIIQDILASTIPIVTFVAPGGARAASAGTYILFASHISAMAPGTNLGAATPIQIGVTGRSFPGSRSKEEKRPNSDEKEDEVPKEKPTVEDKVVNDAVAYIRSLAQVRGRNAEWAEKAVREAASLPAEEALRERVIDFIAEDIKDLLIKLDGRKVSVQNRLVDLKTLDNPVKTIVPDWRSEFLGIITNPNIAYILMLIGIYGLILEFYNPGVLVPGIVGAICLLVAFYAFQILPINYAGLALLLLGIALIVAETFAPSFGILGIGGMAAFVIGSIMLLDTDIPGFGISWMLIGTIALLSAGTLTAVMGLFLKSRLRPVVSGAEELVGSNGYVLDWNGRNGHVRIHGEIWQARAPSRILSGREIVVEKVEGLTLYIREK